MSVEAMAWVWNHSRAKNSARLVLLAIADCASGDGTNAWPSTRELCRKTNLTDRSVQSAIRQCVELGELTVELNAGRRGTNMYTIRMVAPEESSPPKDLPPENPSPPKNLRGYEKSQVNTVPPEESSPPENSSPPKNLPPTPEKSSGGTIMNHQGEIDTSLSRTGKGKLHAGSPEFTAFWAAYPKKKAKGDARKAWQQVLDRGAEPARIIAAARAYAAERDGEDPKYTAYPATWLRAERWEDEPDPAYTPRPAVGRTNADVWDAFAARQEGAA